MKFLDIPEFTKIPSYRADVSIVNLIRNIDKYVEVHGLDLNPDFQRGHVWTELQQVKYIEYILKGGQSGKEFYFNQPGWMCRGKQGDFVIVDGLQRLTAILAFLNDKIKVFGILYSEFEDELGWGLTIRFHINNLKTQKEVLAWYLEMNFGGTPHTQEELDRVTKLFDDA